jgi:hypothetical protein
MRLRTIATALVLMMAMPAVAHAESWAHWKKTHPLHVSTAPHIDPEHLSPLALRELARWGRARSLAVHRRWARYERHERTLGHAVQGTPAQTQNWSVAAIDQLIISVFGNNAEALHVADCESGDNPYARNASGASGVFQLMPEWWAGRFNPFDPVANVQEAYRISNGGTNWSGWLCA